MTSSKRIDKLKECGTLKIIVVGDGTVGKTYLLHTYIHGSPPTSYVPTVFDKFCENLILNSKSHTVDAVYLNNVYNLTLWDTAGQEGYDELRVLSYPDTDAFIVCFSLNSPDSLDNVLSKWYPELSSSTESKPNIILVGTKADLEKKTNEKQIKEIQQKV
jgi:small GTP-binding protein